MLNIFEFLTLSCYFLHYKCYIVYCRDHNSYSLHTSSMSETLKFRGESSALSNLYPCKIVWNGVTYNSSESIYQMEKVLHHKELLSVDNVLDLSATTSGRSAMLRANRLIPPKHQTKEWQNMKKHIMGEVLQEKYDQVPDYSVAVSHPGLLLEDTSNLFWGGRSAGLNTLGQLHRATRDANQPRVTVIGDSLTRYLLDSSDQVIHKSAQVGSSFVEKGAFWEGRKVIQTQVWCNPGITSSRLINRVTRDLCQLDDPTHVYLMVGTNDTCPPWKPAEMCS